MHISKTMVQELHEQGLSYSQIQEKLGISRMSVARALRAQNDQNVTGNILTKDEKLLLESGLSHRKNRSNFQGIFQKLGIYQGDLK